ncbi:hypothetical protein [Limimaricola hongkongensis]|uniref:Uncharacterized protein n=1 Tax=Limimaricola hongkongensis DSM 17492 TaxID=1122180 RepID=A0A017HJ02_9RHOB|nr:hypothetical protein [Limimaricola hongkongensis]EYD73764.1 hypothetical protein Lokhon_00320 [Limimaricola hongkongensis DSM 17492]
MTDEIDPKGLVREAYRIEGITIGECRSIFLDWALSLPEGAESGMAIRRLLERHATAPEGHPMTAVLVEGLDVAQPPRRRGGRAGRAAG